MHPNAGSVSALKEIILYIVYGELYGNPLLSSEPIGDISATRYVNEINDLLIVFEYCNWSVGAYRRVHLPGYR